MIRSFFLQLGLILLFIMATLATLFQFELVHTATPVAVPKILPRASIALMPLDSRPPCTDYVQQLAGMAGYQVTLPPAALLDDYRRPGNTAALQTWLSHEVSRSEAAIISVDMLIHGGLLASRQGNNHSGNATAVIELLKSLHQNHPQVRLYAFSIIPRLFIADNPLTDKFKPRMSEWAILQETVLLFENPLDFARLQKIETELPAELIQRYRDLYATNRQLNLELIKLAQAGVLAGLVLGQDDSASFGLGNLERQRFDNFVNSNPELQKTVFITRGTDEVALNLLGQAITATTGLKKQVYVHYTEAATPDTIMPYMPGPLSRSVAEKLQIAHAEPSESLETADYILTVHAGSARSSAKQLERAAEQIKQWLVAGKNVALVDLAEDWLDSQTLLNYLQKNEAPLYRLIAYAGWNTASNSLGTAVTQAAMVLEGRTAASPSEQLSRDLGRIGFLAGRIMDDWYYQKNFRPILNSSLQQHAVNPYDLQAARTKVSRRIEHELANAFPRLIQRNWKNSLLALPPPAAYTYAVADWEMQSGLPWDRTFEIRINLSPQPAIINSRR